MRIGILLLVVILTQGCLGPPDTFDDMWIRLDGVRVPADFTPVAEGGGGLRSGFAAASAPKVERSFGAPWSSGALCDRIESLVESLGASERAQAGTCGYQTRISSGWRAKLLNVWSYRLLVYAVQPENVTSLSEQQCAEARARHEKSALAGTLWRYGPCWVIPGEALVGVIVYGKMGW